jgi:hypothetical protein
MSSKSTEGGVHAEVTPTGVSAGVSDNAINKASGALRLLFPEAQARARIKLPSGNEWRIALRLATTTFRTRSALSSPCCSAKKPVDSKTRVLSCKKLHAYSRSLPVLSLIVERLGPTRAEAPASTKWGWPRSDQCQLDAVDPARPLAASKSIDSFVRGP